VAVGVAVRVVDGLGVGVAVRVAEGVAVGVAVRATVGVEDGEFDGVGVARRCEIRNAGGLRCGANARRAAVNVALRMRNPEGSADAAPASAFGPPAVAKVVNNTHTTVRNHP